MLSAESVRMTPERPGQPKASGKTGGAMRESSRASLSRMRTKVSWKAVAGVGVLLLLVCGVLLATSDPACAANTDPPPGPPLPVEGLLLRQTSQEWTLQFLFSGPWSHWSMGSPPRIVIDLLNARSRLPAAPGLYTMELPDGPVKILRTSQFRDELGDRRVRITLVLRRPVAYSTEDVGGAKLLRIERAQGVPWGPEWVRIVGVISKEQRHAVGIASTPTASGAAPPAQVASGREEGSRESGVQKDTEAAGAGPAALAAARAADRPGDAGGPTAESPPIVVEERIVPDSVLERIFADTTLFVTTPPQREKRAWLEAAERLLEAAQNALLASDTSLALASLRKCERFYADTPPGRQATLLRHCLLEAYGADPDSIAPPAAPTRGPWPLLYPDALAFLARRALEGGYLEAAEHLVRVWQEAYPEEVDWAKWAVRLAEAYFDAGDNTKSTYWLDEAMAANTDLAARPEVLLLLGLSLQAQGRMQRAEKILARAEELAPPGRLAQRAKAARADVNYSLRQYYMALQIYRALIEEGPTAVESDWALYQIGNCLLKLGQTEKAREVFTRLRRVAPQSFWAPFAEMRLAELEAAPGATSG